MTISRQHWQAGITSIWIEEFCRAQVQVGASDCSQQGLRQLLGGVPLQADCHVHAKALGQTLHQPHDVRCHTATRHIHIHLKVALAPAMKACFLSPSMIHGRVFHLRICPRDKNGMSKTQFEWQSVAVESLDSRKTDTTDKL